MRIRWSPAMATLVLLASSARADQFGAIGGKQLAEALKGPSAKAVGRLSVADLGTTPDLLKDARGALLAVRTGRGNVARLLVTPELRRPEAGGPPVPVFVLERFDTFDAADLAARMAGGRSMMLFPGFQVDLDTGQVVPEGQGGDLSYPARGEPSIAPTGGATLHVLTRPPAPDPSRPPMPTPGRAVVPTDFAGRYRLFANGQWSGTLDLLVDARGEVTGAFRSDARGASYPVTGRVAADAPNRATLGVKFPRSRGDFEGYLWTEGKGAMAGTFRLDDRPYGFFAVREGGRFAPEGSDVGAMDGGDGLVLDVVGDKVRLDGRDYATAELAPALKAKFGEGRAPSLTIRSKDADVSRAIEAVGASGVRWTLIRVEATGPTRAR